MFFTVAVLNKIQEPMRKKCITDYKIQEPMRKKCSLHCRVGTEQETRTNAEEMFFTVGQAMRKKCSDYPRYKNTVDYPTVENQKCSLQQGSHCDYKTRTNAEEMFSTVGQYKNTEQDTRTNAEEMFSTVGQSLNKIQEPMWKKCSLQQGSH